MTFLYRVSFVLVAFGCERFETPSGQECEDGLSSLMSHYAGRQIDKKLGANRGETSTLTNIAKAFGQEVLGETLVTKKKIAWCEVHLSRHDTNCLRAAQTGAELEACGVVVDAQGHLKK